MKAVVIALVSISLLPCTLPSRVFVAATTS